MLQKEERCRWSNLGLDGEADCQGYYFPKEGRWIADWAGAQLSIEDLGSERAWAQSICYSEHKSPLSIH